MEQSSDKSFQLAIKACFIVVVNFSILSFKTKKYFNHSYKGLLNVCFADMQL
jgi:hypothetical protein